MSAPPEAGRASLEQMLGRIDRRLVYLGLFLITLMPLVGKWRLHLYTTPPPLALMETIDALPTKKVVFIASNWDAGTQAENRPQLIALVRHLVRRGIKFVVFSVGSPNAPQLADTAIKEAVTLEGAEGRWEYGRDWANLGYKRPNSPWYRGLARDIPSAFKTDWKNTALADLAVTRGVQRFGEEGQVSMILDITGSNTIEAWYQYLSPTKTKIGLGCTAVMAPEQYPYLDSGQLSGLLTGMKGAAEYEQLINAPGRGMPAMAGQSFAHLYIFILIALGNLSLLLGWMERRRARR